MHIDNTLHFNNRETIFDLLTCLSGQDESFLQDATAIICDMISGYTLDIDEAVKTIEKYRK